MASSAQGTLLRGWFVDAQVMLVYNPVIAVKIGDSSLVVKLSWQTKRRSVSGGLWPHIHVWGSFPPDTLLLVLICVRMDPTMDPTERATY